MLPKNQVDGLGVEEAMQRITEKLKRKR